MFDDMNQNSNGQDNGTSQSTDTSMEQQNSTSQSINEESAASSENQYRYSKNEIPYNNTSGQNGYYNDAAQNYGSNTSYGSDNSYFNNSAYNNSYSNTSYNNGSSYNGGSSYTGYNGYANTNTNEGYSYGQEQNQETQQNNDTIYNNVNQNTEADKKKIKTKKTRNGFMKNKAVRLIASALAFGLIAGGVMFGLYYAGVSFIPSSSSSTTYEIQTVTPSLSSSSYVESEDETEVLSMNVEAVAQAALPAMVELNGTTTVTSSSSSSYGSSWGGTQSYEAETSGTGIIVGQNDTELLILTNAHVVDDVSNLSCTFIDGTAVDCTVKGSKSDQDIAVVAVNLSDMDSSTISSIAIAELGESDDVVLGQEVVAIGNALGEGQSVTSGIISAMDRSITVDNVTFSGLFLTDAAINSGNSGGALLNAAGQVIAINFAKTSETGVEGMAYSIPVSAVRDLIDSLMTRETRSVVSDDEASYLGISAIDITSSIASQYSYPQGVMVREVVSGSAADAAGLGTYDIIVSFDDQTVSSMSGLQSIMKYYAAGETVTIDYYHIEGNEYVLKSVDVTLGSKN